MKMTVPIVVVSMILIAGCASARKVSSQAYTPVPAKESFSVGAFQPSTTEYNFKHYDDHKAMVFLASVSSRFSEGEVVAVDGLKWQKTDGAWEPIPNPPIPVLKPGDDIIEYDHKYAVWVNNHPHFGYPPLPMDDKE